MPYAKYAKRKPISSFKKRSYPTQKAITKSAPIAPYGFKGSYYRSKKELKFLDRDQRVDDDGVVGTGSFANVSPSGKIHFINGIGQGTGESDRIGRECWIKSVQLRFNIQLGIPNPASSLVGNHIRVIVYSDKAQNGTANLVTDVLETANYSSLTSMKNASRIWIHHDKLLSLSSNGDRSLSYTAYMKMNKKAVYGGSDASISSMQTNGLHVLVISTTDETAYTTPTAYSFGARVRYNDA